MARLRVGLTGGIGSGKSVVAAQFAALGASIIDTDQIARGMTVPGGPAMPAIVAEFGPEFADARGAMDRERMRALVFSDLGAKARLEGILHPLIRATALAAAESASGAYVIYDVPLLVESGSWRDRVDRVLVVDCPEDVQVTRVTARSGLDASQVRAIMATQATRAARLAAADDIINNEGELAALAPQIARLHDLYLAFSAGTITITSQRL
jgi:dephospho-CoA kinase